ncbi:transcriptional repressor [Reichenbachiella carrageenanivorans]|uniref:Transcriptional repressor n=1 Tax=Reichenbachiella carrageenanivorans TaxID=2979869 RepID=A0ABY6CWA6_9BACT|nr:transcriptional repressor [Reichenbachiella carrageenanivorans]UXX77685.1 transcriptional repressor [Reichenbachiella carrageenanivorans]
METKGRKEILKRHGMRVTDCRLDVLDLFINSRQALSQKDLEEKLTAYDRVTLYRTLHSFLESGVLHKIPNDNGIASYGVCFDTCSPSEHHHDHLHFKCNSCGQLECIEEAITLPAIHLPQHYQLGAVDIIVNGVCGACIVEA